MTTNLMPIYILEQRYGGLMNVPEEELATLRETMPQREDKVVVAPEPVIRRSLSSEMWKEPEKQVFLQAVKDNPDAGDSRIGKLLHMNKNTVGVWRDCAVRDGMLERRLPYWERPRQRTILASLRIHPDYGGKTLGRVLKMEEGYCARVKAKAKRQGMI